MLEEKLTELKQKLIECATLIENMIEKSIEALLKKNKELFLEVIQKDEVKSDELELEVDELCINLIAQYQPRAKDLRTVVTILKINNDLERIADLAVNICESGLFLIDRPAVKPLIDIPRMAKIVADMVKDSINSFVNEDVKLAEEVWGRDGMVDALRDQILRELVTYMSADPTTIERANHLIRISRNLERAADLATNIVEDVIFMVEGRVIKHKF